jgi:hypothetical protein
MHFASFIRPVRDGMLRIAPMRLILNVWFEVGGSEAGGAGNTGLHAGIASTAAITV